ncbi:MAG: tetratricopeptide repeat protein [Pyrinomonadaceae bacterium]
MKRNFRYIWFFVFGAVLSFSALPKANAQGYGDRNRAGGNGTYNIQGRVTSPDGKPAKDVRVSLSGADFTNGSTVTDTDGNFTFSNIPTGNYNITIKSTGEYESENEVLTIAEGTTYGQTFNLSFFLRLPGVKKNALNPTNNPMLNDVPKEALKKQKSAADSMQKNDLKAALASLDEAIAIYPNFAYAYNEKGMILLRENDLNDALAAFAKAIEVKPDYFDAKLNFGFTLLNQKNYEKAEVVLRDVLKQKEDMPTTNMYLGIALLGLKKTDAAEASFKKAVSLKGGENLAQAHKYLGGIYMQKKENAEAAAELEKYLQLAPKAPDADKIKGTIADLKKQNSQK